MLSGGVLSVAMRRNTTAKDIGWWGNGNRYENAKAGDLINDN